MIQVQDALERCRRYRRRILEISQQVPAAHVAPAFSCVEIVDALYSEVMRPKDIFIMSKGHGCLAQYVVLEDRGVINSLDLRDYCQPEGFLGAHPDYAPNMGLHASTGSLGHGLGIGLGQAWAERLRGSAVRVYVLLSDGECQEGSTWEAVAMAANLRMSNLTVLVDCNNFGGLEKMSEGFPAFNNPSLREKFRAFGWAATNVLEGHNSGSIVGTLEGLQGSYIPHVAVCHTTKGKGVKFMEDEAIWHYRSPSPEEYEQAMRELD